MSILKIESLCKYYGNKKNETKALDGISLEVQTGEFLGIMGVADPGKSTLLNCVASVIRPTGGQILVNGKNRYPFAERRRTFRLQRTPDRLPFPEL